MLRRIKKKRHWEKNRHEIFRLNIFPNEFEAEPESVIIDFEFDRNTKTRNLRTQIGDLQRDLQTMERELKQVSEEKENAVKAKEKESRKARICEQKNKALSNQIVTLESEAAAKDTQITNSLQENQQLRLSNQELQQQQKQALKPLGYKRLSECGPDAITKTRHAYREKYKEDVNNYGQNRGLTLDKLVLKNTENGEPFVVNMEKPPTYENLDEYGKKLVEEHSRWKDGEVVSDRSYAKLRKVADVPAASHVKCFEKETNQKIGNATMVISIPS